jgi:hypothetical protein
MRTAKLRQRRIHFGFFALGLVIGWAIAVVAGVVAYRLVGECVVNVPGFQIVPQEPSHAPPQT